MSRHAYSSAGRSWLTQLILLATATLPHAQAANLINLSVEQDGIYRVPFSDLKALLAPTASSRLQLLDSGQPVPFTVISDDAIFGMGDTLEFVGYRLDLAGGWHGEYPRQNVYQLSVLRDDQVAERTRPSEPKGPTVTHLEKDLIRVALPQAKNRDQIDRWYWQRITAVSSDVFQYSLQWEQRPESIRVGMTGLSYDAVATNAGLSGHHVDIYLNGQFIKAISWNGQESVIADVSHLQLPQEDAGALLELRVPKRPLPQSEYSVVDAVLINWIELQYPENARMKNSIPARDGQRRLTTSGEYLKPSRLEAAQVSSNLSGKNKQADYLMIAHPDLLDALSPLVNFHTSQGLSVEVINVAAIYDEFNHGVTSPAAIRSFIRHTRHKWRKPAPKMVLLAGDASWGAPSHKSDRYTFLPTDHVLVGGFFAASDNALVAITEGSWRPDLAIGRLPAGNAQELSALVAKILARTKASSRTEHFATWISGADNAFQSISTDLASTAQRQGFKSSLVFPSGDNNVDQKNVLSAFDRSDTLVHFLGHGGRFVWRTGPQDLNKAQDLFHAEDLLSLPERDALPLVLSMTCSSGPFDHPSADSLAEQLLHLPKRGAFSVVAASSQVPASDQFSTEIIDGLLRRGKTIGAAVMEAKQKVGIRSVADAYNLLGDPGMLVTGAQGE